MMEPERKIEKLLQAYAKKRRAQAGEPLTMHPAVRRRLQDEVARNLSEGDEDDSLTLWQLLRQQWMFLAGFALIIFFASSLLVPTLSSTKKKAQRIGTVNNLKQIGLAIQMDANDNDGRLPASLDKLTKQFLPAYVLTNPADGQRFVYVAGGETLENLGSNAVLAFSSTATNGGAVLYADGRVEYADAGRFATLTNIAMQNLQMAIADRGTGSTAGSNEESAQAGLGGIGAAPATSVPPAARNLPQLPGELALLSGRLFTNTSAFTNTSTVLTRFKLQLNGSSVVMLDHDGSIYNGTLTLLPAQTGSGEAYHEKIERASGYVFQVAGTNQTLNQQVVFRGTLIPTALPLPSSKTTPVPNGVALQTFSANQTTEGLDFRIVGTAIIGETNQIIIVTTPGR